MELKPEKIEYVWFNGPHFPEGLYAWVGWAGERRERIKTLIPVDSFYHVYEVDSRWLRPASAVEVALYGRSKST